MRSPKLWIEHGGKEWNQQRLPPQAEGEDPTQDGIIFRMDHNLVLILREMLNQTALNRVAIKGRVHELLRKFIFQCILGEGRIGCISGDGPESAVMWHTCFFDSLSY